MGENSAELNLDLGSIYVPKTINSRSLIEVSTISDSEKSSKLNGYVRKLEDELRKIQNLKTELPLCMFLLNDAIWKLKEDIMQCQRTEVRPPATRGLTPLKGNSDKDETEKKAWLSSAQLCISTTGNVKRESSYLDIKKQVSADFDLKWREKKDDYLATESRFQACNFRNIGGAFVPFEPQVSLSASVAAGELGSLDSNLGGNRGSVGSGSSSVTAQRQMINQLNRRPNYGRKKLQKRRRCWSPELHRRFVDALEQLGGPQSATPKHIRDLMKVEDITNDEVKSHLQKYRIHFRKLPALATWSSASTSTARLPMSPTPNRYECELKANNSEPGSPPSPFPSGESAKGVSTITRSDSPEQEEESREP